MNAGCVAEQSVLAHLNLPSHLLRNMVGQMHAVLCCCCAGPGATCCTGITEFRTRLDYTKVGPILLTKCRFNWNLSINSNSCLSSRRKPANTAHVDTIPCVTSLTLSQRELHSFFRVPEAVAESIACISAMIPKRRKVSFGEKVLRSAVTVAGQPSYVQQ